MRPRPALTALAFFAAVAAAAAAGQGFPGADPIEAYRRGVAALEARDAVRASAELEQAAAGLPGHPDVLYLLAKAKALSGDSTGAILLLQQVVAVGYGGGAPADPAFAGLSEQAGYRALLPRMAENTKAIASSVTAFTLPERDLIPEGIAWDPVGRTLFVGSLAKRKIVSVAADGRIRDFVPTGREGLGQVAGMKVDPVRRSLWACSLESEAADGTRRSALFRFDLSSGRLRQKLASPAGGKHLFNDLAVTKDGELYLTDSEEGSVYRLRPGANGLEIFSPPGSLIYPNGIALSADERFLYVANEPGIVVFEREAGRSFPLERPKDVSLAGIDGLSLHRGTLVGIQNGAEPHRVALFALSPSGDRVTAGQVLERGNPLFEIPTTGAVAGDVFYYLANAQLSALGPGGTVRDPEKRRPVVILMLELPRSDPAPAAPR